MTFLIVLTAYILIGCGAAGFAAKRFPKKERFDDKAILWVLVGVFWPVGLLVIGPGYWAFSKARGQASTDK